MTSWWRGTGLVVSRELAVGFRRRSYRITLVLLLLGGAAAVTVPRLLASDDTPSYDLAVVGDAPPGFAAALDEIAAALEIEVEVAPPSGPAGADAAADAVADGDLDAALVWPPGAAAGDDAEPPTLLQEEGTSPDLLAAVANAAVVSSTTQRLEAAGVDPGRAATVLARPPVNETVDTPETTGQAAVGFVVVLLLYISILSAGTQVATGVAVEKTNRIAESLLATVRASQLLAGKVIGIGALALAALAALAVPVAVSLAMGGDLDVPHGATGQVVAGLGWFVLGFTLYACAYAGLGALVDRQEEVGGAIMPLTTGLVVTYFLAIQAQESPDSTLAVVTSMFPLTAPMVMPMRTAVGAAGAAQVAVAVAAIVVTAAVFVRVGAVVYRRAIIRTGRRLKLREVLRAG